MNKILSCIDTRGNTDAVIDWTAWAAQRLGRPVEFLHVLERHPERAESTDFSGTIGLGAQESLLQALSEQDEQRSREAREAGRELLARARGRAAAAGLTQSDARLRHGDFVETAIELQAEAGLFVLGEHYHADAGQPGRRRTDHHLERVIRGVACPVLVATAGTQPLTDRLRAVGTLTANESVLIRSEIPGRVERIHFDEGQPVTAGEPLITLDGAEYRAQVAQTEATVTVNRLNFQRAAAVDRTGKDTVFGVHQVGLFGGDRRFRDG